MKKTTIKTTLHPRNQHRERYDFKLLCESLPQLGDFVLINEYGDESIDFFDPDAVLTLNKALLKKYYGIDNWEIPEGYLCPPIPGRAEYIHHIADLLNNKDPERKIKCLDIGVGANCIYPIIGVNEYGWDFVGTEIDQTALDSAQKIIDGNSFLQGKVELRFQAKKNLLFHGIIQENEKFDLTICNPPFHASAKAAAAGNTQKLSNLKKRPVRKAALNFGGQSTELWCDGGEEKFILKMIDESLAYDSSVGWFTSMVSKSEHLKNIHFALEKTRRAHYKTINLTMGNKVSRVIAWTFNSELV